MYMHQNGKLNYSAPTEDEGFTMYIHDPDDQVYSLGGANMIVKLPDGYHSTVQNSSNSQGQINLADPRWKHRTMDRNGVVAFEYEVTEDSLCIIGFPEAKLYAKSNPGGEVKGLTDTDFFVRVLDVYPPSPQYPTGREFFVVEGCVNARARDYARALVEAKGLETKEIDNIPFTNINIGEIYEYYFRLMPIAYTWGRGHKIKILISSSNHTRYQVNPNIPINDGDFFRRQPLDGQTYIFNDPEKGEIEMEPRVAVQRIAHSPEYPTSIMLPVYDKTFTNIREVLAQSGSELRTLVYPNPATDAFNVYVSKPNENYDLVMFNEIGQEVYQTEFTDELKIDAKRFDKGIYFVQVRDVKTKETYTTKVTIQ
jgi:predicted acyl esterase